MPAIQHLLAVNTRRGLRVVDARADLIAPLDVHVFDVEGVDVAWEIAQDRQQDVDQEIGAAA